MLQEHMETVALGKPKLQPCGARVNYPCFHRSNNNENPWQSPTGQELTVFVPSKMSPESRQVKPIFFF